MARALKIFQDESFPLDDIQVAAPCPADWNDMVGSDKVRFCASCQKNVFNLSGMKRDEAIELLRATEGRVCVRFFRRADGTVLTEDCPVGVALLLRRAKRATYVAAAVSLGAVAALLAALAGPFGGARKACQRIDEVKQSIEAVTPAPVPPPEPMMGVPPPPPPMLGEVAVPPPEPRVIMGKPVAPPREVKGDVAPSIREIKGKVRMVEPAPALHWDRE